MNLHVRLFYDRKPSFSERIPIFPKAHFLMAFGTDILPVADEVSMLSFREIRRMPFSLNNSISSERFFTLLPSRLRLSIIMLSPRSRRDSIRSSKYETEDGSKWRCTPIMLIGVHLHFSFISIFRAYSSCLFYAPATNGHICSASPSEIYDREFRTRF